MRFCVDSSHGGAPRPRPKLTPKTLFVLGSINLIDCINASLLTPYVTEMVADFMNLPLNDPQVGNTVGLLVGLYSICEVVFSVFWGWVADRMGRKPALLIGLAGSVIAPIMFGLGQSLEMVFFARALDGFFCGNVGVSRTYLGEIVDASNETKAFSFLSVCFSIGLFLGPMLGGQLVHPARWAPGVFAGSVFDHYPYLLPNLTYAIFAAIAWVIGAMFLEETLRRPGAQSQGSEQSRQANAPLSRAGDEARVLRRERSNVSVGTDPQGATCSYQLPDDLEEPRRPAGERCYPRVLLQVMLAYCALSGCTAASTQLFVLIFSFPTSDGGFGFGPGQLGLLQNCAAIGLMLTQCLVFPFLTKRFGFFKTFGVGWALYVVSWGLVPVYGLMADPKFGNLRYIPIGAMMFFCAAGTGMCYPTAFAFINRASAGLEKGKVNGLANSCGALCRGVFPPVAAAFLGLTAPTGMVDGKYLAVHVNLFLGTAAMLLAAPGLRAANSMSAGKPMQRALSLTGSPMMSPQPTISERSRSGAGLRAGGRDQPLVNPGEDQE